MISYLRSKSKFWVVPPLFYLVMFCLLTYPLILDFSTHFFTDSGDGLQNAWNIWWVNKAITQLHQSPYFTTYLHYPLGTSLLGHTLNPFNGLLGIFLLKFLTLVETHNFIVLFSFVMGGVTTFWLAYHITNSYWSSLVAGYIFTFSQYHFMHAEGHLQLVSLEWIPLFVLSFYKLVTAPSSKRAAIASLVLFLVILCDYYYFFFCVLTGIIIMVWYALANRETLFLRGKQYLSSFGIFLISSVSTSGILAASLLQLNIRDPLLGAHDPYSSCLDFLAPFIPGGHWRFARLTEFYWSRLPGNINESSVYVGLSVIGLVYYTWCRQKEWSLKFRSFFLWYSILCFFGIMAFGPALQIGGEQYLSGLMPYILLEKLFPPLKMSGCPVRMMVMVMLAGSIISSIGLVQIFERLPSKRIVSGVAIVAFLLVFDFLPKPLPSTRIIIPEYVYLLKNMPEAGGFMDFNTERPMALYYQTVHEKPLINGYISRYPSSVLKELNDKKNSTVNDDYFINYDIHYLLTAKKDFQSNPGKTLIPIYSGFDLWLYKI